VELLPIALRRHAVERGEQPAVAFAGGRGEIHDRYSFADLDRRARAIAAALQREATCGARVMLLFKPGLDFLAAFMGCQYAAMVAVPIQPPAGISLRSGRRASKAQKQVLDRLQRFTVIAEDASAEAVLTTAELAGQVADLGELAPALAAACWITVDEVDDSLAEAWREPEWAADDLSLLQYTSGSTSTPKGVAVAHAHLAANAEAIRRLGDLEPSIDSCVSWLPPTHDMGLVGTLLQQILLGSSLIQLSPITFLKRPLSWLKLISENGATLTAAPNFAFDLCVEKSTEETRRELDLSSLRVVVVGAEPIRAASLERFVRAFGPCGFRADALYPCYGLAESTLIVSGRRVVHSVCFDRQALREGEARVVDDRAAEALRLVSCGRPVGDAEVRIVDPDSLGPCPEGRAGEIWVASSHVAAGYFGKPEISASVFDARLRGEPEVSFLRTGDEGVLHREEVFVTGRYKDVMIFGGANHHPQDIEQTVASAHSALRSDRIVAFSSDSQAGERLVIGVDLRRVPRVEWPAVGSEIRQAVLAQHGLNVHALVALNSGALTKTTSGKPQRYLARQRFERGELGEVT
jgi:acyl-CoA synthetase (AMP-forming)/AMP-acid ligase II